MPDSGVWMSIHRSLSESQSGIRAIDSAVEFRKWLSQTQQQSSAGSGSGAVATATAAPAHVDDDNVDNTVIVSLASSPSTAPLRSSGALLLSGHMENLVRLVSLSLPRNELGDAGVIAICGALEGTLAEACLRSLTLDRNGIGPAGAVAVAGLVRRAHRRIGERGADIDLTGERTTWKSFGAEVPGLRELSLGSNPLKEDGVIAVADALRSNRTLIEVKLFNVSIGDMWRSQGAVSLAGCLNSTNVQSLNLSGNAIGDSGAKAFAAALRTNTRLRILDISRNHISPIGAQSLASALRENVFLQELGVFGFGDSPRADIVLYLKENAEGELLAQRNARCLLFCWEESVRQSSMLGSLPTGVIQRLVTISTYAVHATRNESNR